MLMRKQNNKRVFVSSFEFSRKSWRNQQGIKTKPRKTQSIFFPLSASFLSSHREFNSQLAEDNMTVKDGFSLLLNLKLPTLLGILDLIQHVGSTAGAGQHIMGICKRLVILKVQERRTSDSMIHVKHTRTIAVIQPQRLEQLDCLNTPSNSAKHSQAFNTRSRMNSTIEIGDSNKTSNREVFVQCSHESPFPKTFPLRNRNQDKDSGHLRQRSLS